MPSIFGERRHLPISIHSTANSLDMKVLSIAILKWKKDTPEPVILCQEC